MIDGKQCGVGSSSVARMSLTIVEVGGCDPIIRSYRKRTARHNNVQKLNIFEAQECCTYDVNTGRSAASVEIKSRVESLSFR